MKVVVTGGAGYIASVMVRRLLEEGHEVIIVDNLSRGFKEAIPKGAKFIQADVGDLDKVLTKQDGVEAVMHWAAYAYVGESVKDPGLYWENNAIGTLRLLKAMRNLDIKKLVFASSCATYGCPEKMPITEDTPTNPVNSYGMTKLTADMAISTEAEAYDLAAISLRFFNVAGCYQDAGERHDPETHIIPLALAAIAGDLPAFTIFGDDYPTPDGTNVRDYVHVVDLAQAGIKALARLEAGKHKIYNLGNGGGFSNKQVAEAVEKVTGKKLPLKIGPRRPGDPPVLVASSAKAETELGWKPERPTLEQMISDAWEFYQKLKR